MVTCIIIKYNYIKQKTKEIILKSWHVGERTMNKGGSMLFYEKYEKNLNAFSLLQDET